ncbi:hypothetical protein P7C73_g630, partial [Tremellales sp. Uapishka_1]
MASSTLRPHRSPSPSPTPTTPINPANPAKLTRQSLGPTSARGFAGLGISSPTAMSGQGQPRHVSSSVAFGMGGQRESLSPRPSLGATNRAVSSGQGPRPSSEFLPGGGSRELKTPETEQIDQWFEHLASVDNTLEEMAAASTDQNFTEELGAIEQWFKVLSEAERTAALYSLIQYSTPVQVRFFLSVLHHMAQSDPMSALLSPNPNNGMQAGLQAQMEHKLAGMNLKSPSAGGGSGFPGSPTVNQYLAPESALESNGSAAQKQRLRQNRISAPGTLASDSRWASGHLDQVMERGVSPGLDSNASARSRSPAPSDPRPKSTDFAGLANQPESQGPFTRSPRPSGGVGLGIGGPDLASPVASPLMDGNWASMVNTPLVPMFTDPNIDNVNNALSMASWQLAAAAQNPNSRVALDDARKFRRPGAGSTPRNVSGQYNDDGEMVNAHTSQPGRGPASPLGNGGFGAQTWARSPVTSGGEFGLGMGGIGLGGNDLSGLGMLGFNPLLNNATAAQMLAMAQAQQMNSATAASFAQAGYGGPQTRAASRPQGRRSPMLGGGGKHSPSPAQTGGGAGGGAGVAGPDDVDLKVLEDIATWLRVLRLHKYTSNFEKCHWREMTMMTDKDLQEQGVAALGARNKMLKTFHNVRTKFDIPHPEGQEEYAPGASKAD